MRPLVPPCLVRATHKCEQCLFLEPFRSYTILYTVRLPIYMGRTPSHTFCSLVYPHTLE